MNPSKSVDENPALQGFRQRRRPTVSRNTSLVEEEVSLNQLPTGEVDLIAIDETELGEAEVQSESEVAKSKPATEVVIEAPTLPPQIDQLITVAARRNIRLEESLDDEISDFVQGKRLSIEILLEALYLHAKKDEAAMEDILTVAKERMKERKEAGKLRRVYSQMQKYR